jgi:hypothetical protein
MRLPLLALALFIVLPACKKDQAASPLPGEPGGEKVCTMIGCIDGLRAELKKATPWQPGSYTFNFELDGESVECKGALPLKACEAGPSLSCSADAGVQIGESGCALPAAQHGFSDIQFSGSPKQVRLTISQDDKPLHSADLTPEYITSKPNGEGCEPTCRSARAEIAIP